MSDNVRRDNRRALPKYLLTILLFGLLGGVLGFFTGVAGAAGVAETVRQALDRVLAVCAPWGIVGSAVVLLGAGWYLYAAAKRRFAAWDGEDEDAMDTELETLTQNLDTYYGMTYQEYLDQQCISDAAFRKLNSVAYLAQDLQAALEERGEFEAGEADLDAMIEEAGYTRAKHILLAFPTNEDGSAATDEQKAAVLEEANQLLAQIRAAADPAAEFDAVMNQRSDDGRDENGDLYMPEGYTFYGDGYLADGTGALVSEFVNAAKALAVGEISDPVETSYGYHILMREDFTDEERQQLRDSMASIYPNYAMNQRNEEWIAEAVVETTPAYEALDPHAFYVNMAEMAQAWQAEREAEQAAQATASPAAESETPAAETETPAAESGSPAPAETSSAE